MSTIHHFTGTEDHFDWENIKELHYTSESIKNTSGKIMIGTDDGAEHFVFRYFCVEPGGHSTLNDQHAHPHGVMILHGRALVTLEDKQYELGPRDVVFVQPWQSHSFAAVGDEPMGFLCVIPNLDMMAKLENLKQK